MCYQTLHQVELPSALFSSCQYCVETFIVFSDILFSTSVETEILFDAFQIESSALNVTHYSHQINVGCSIFMFFFSFSDHAFKLWDQTMAKMDDKIPVSSNCLALVPWVPPQATVGAFEYAGSQSGSQSSQEPMEAEEAGAAPMAVEENREQMVSGIDVDVIQQWQQHCMAPEFLPNTPSRLMS